MPYWHQGVLTPNLGSQAPSPAQLTLCRHDVFKAASQPSPSDTPNALETSEETISIPALRKHREAQDTRFLVMEKHKH
jgi:hypothetical protein